MSVSDPSRDSPARDDERISAWIEEFASFMVLSGIPRMPARVLVCLMAEDSGALTSAELSQRLKISPAAVSGAIRYLATVHMVHRTHQPGSRREVYQVGQDVIYQAAVGQMPTMMRWEGMLNKGVQTIGADTEAARRLADSADFIQFMTGEFEGLMERWEEHRRRR